MIYGDGAPHASHVWVGWIVAAFWELWFIYHAQRRLEVPCQEGFQFLDDHYSIFVSPVPSNLLQGHQGGETGESTFICKSHLADIIESPSITCI